MKSGFVANMPSERPCGLKSLETCVRYAWLAAAGRGLLILQGKFIFHSDTTQPCSTIFRCDRSWDHVRRHVFGDHDDQFHHHDQPRMRPKRPLVTNWPPSSSPTTNARSGRSISPSAVPGGPPTRRAGTRTFRPRSEAKNKLDKALANAEQVAELKAAKAAQIADPVLRGDRYLVPPSISKNRSIRQCSSGSPPSQTKSKRRSTSFAPRSASAARR